MEKFLKKPSKEIGKMFKRMGESTRRREPVQKETRSLQKAGEESAGKGTPEGTGRNRKMF